MYGSRLILMSKNNKKIKQSLRRVISNNLFLLLIALKAAPLTVINRLIGPSIGSVTIFFEHTIQVVFILECIEKNRSFSDVVIMVSIIFCWVTLAGYVRDNVFNHRIQPKGSEKIAIAVRELLYTRAHKMDLACYDDPAFYNDFIWAMDNSQSRIDNVINTIGSWFGNIVGFTLYGAFIMLTDPVGFIFVAASFAVATVFRMVTAKLNYARDQVLNPLMRKRNYISRVFYLPDYAKEIRLSNVKEQLIDDYIETERSIQSELKKRNRKIALFQFLGSYIQGDFIIDFLFLLYLMYMVIICQSMGFAALYGMYRSSRSIKGAIGGLSGSITATFENSLYIEKIRTFLNKQPTVVNKPDAIPARSGTLEMKNVSFSYPGTETDSLSDVNMTINPGEKIAIVGYNGAGKTTLIKLLMRLYDPSGGEILCSDENIKDFELDSFRNQFAVLFQDYQIYAATLAENILADDSKPDGERLKYALEASGFAERVAKMPNGVNTHLTREFMEGQELSGGERQKLAISRCLYKNSPVLILDEPSSALDPVAEYEFNNAMLKLSQDKTVIIISHRLSTTKMADRIYMFEMGKLIESGSHVELMALESKYAEMFRVQAEKYRSVAGV